MKTLGNTLIALTGIALLAAIWAPGTWWQWLATAAITLLAAGFILGNQDDA